MARDPVVLFDLDGTLTDSEPGIARGMAVALEAVGEPLPTAEEVRRFIGPPTWDGFVAHGLDPARAHLAVDAYRAYYAETGLYENELFESVDAVLDGLRDRGFVLAVATSKREDIAERILEHFGVADRFTVVRGADETGDRRHKHEVIGAALQALGHPSGAVTMVGDRAHDVEGAAAHGIPCIGVTWGFGTKAELEAAGAKVIVDTRPALAYALVVGAA